MQLSALTDTLDACRAELHALCDRQARRRRRREERRRRRTRIVELRRDIAELERQLRALRAEIAAS